jgi:hypothetical protein
MQVFPVHFEQSTDELRYFSTIHIFEQRIGLERVDEKSSIALDAGLHDGFDVSAM